MDRLTSIINGLHWSAIAYETCRFVGRLLFVLVVAGCTIKTGEPLAMTRRPGVNLTPPSVAPPPAPLPNQLPNWNDPLDIHVDDPVTELEIRLGIRLRSRNNCLYLFSDQKLTAAADQFAKWMASTGRLGHQGQGGSWPADRVRAAGYPASKVGEVVAGDFETPISVINGWLQSPGHKATILDPEFTQFGCAMAEDTRGRKCWVVVLARPANRPEPSP
jgi:hypothetical protein